MIQNFLGIEADRTHLIAQTYSQLNNPHYSTIAVKLGIISLWTSNDKVLYSFVNMFEESNDLSPDMEWMLQSNQVDNDTVIEILVRDYYRRIFRLILSWLSYPQEAHRATEETFGIAVSGERKYREDMSVFDWIAGIAEEVCQKRKAHLDTHQFLNPRLIQSIHNRKPHEDLTERQVEQAIKNIKIKVRSKNASAYKKAGFQEMVLISIALVVAFFLIRYIDTAVSSYLQPMASDQSKSASNSTNHSSDDKTSPNSLSTNFSPLERTDAFPPQYPLTRNSTHDDIWRRILISRYLWNNIWADVWMILHGPTDYTGPLRAQRHQIWLDQDIGGIHLSGPLEAKPDRIERITATSIGPEPTSFFTGTEDYSRLGSQVPWFYLSSDMILSTPYMTNFFFIADYDFPPQRVWYRVVDEQVWAGRQAVIVEMTDRLGNLLARFWLDALTGIALREQYLGNNSPDNILLEISVSKIEFDVSIPQGIDRIADNELLERGFSQDHTGQPEPRTFKPTISPFQAVSSWVTPPLSPPPIDFDPSQSWLTFAVEEGSHRQKDERIVHVFGDSSYLGNIKLRDPFRTICDRTKYGGKIIISQWPDSTAKVSSIISRYDLLELNQKKYSIPETYITRLAFSPHNRLIAVAGISPNETSSDLYIVDTTTGEVKLLPGIEDAWSLAWSPDGSQLASLNWPSFRMYTQSTMHINLYNLETGEVTSYLRHADFPWGMSIVEVPVSDWKANFQLAMGGLEPCAAPP